MRAAVIIGLSLAVSASVEAQPAGDGLQAEPMLHPGDAFTAMTLREGELIYNQSVQTLPLPSWAWWGVTDWLTAEIDLLPLLGGLFVEPHLPVPSFNFRFRLRDGGGDSLSVAYETMVQYLWQPFAQADFGHVHIVRDGLSWYHRVNVTLPVSRTVLLHASVGGTYSRSIVIENRERETYRGRAFRDLVSPDGSLALDLRPTGWLSLHAAVSYGTTFVYLDNVPRKVEAIAAFRLAPFQRSRFGILRTLRIESAIFTLYFPDAGEWATLPVPIFPYLYWQWRS
jgi:hypothetical protein